MELIFDLAIATVIILINFLLVGIIGATLIGIYKTFQKMGLNGWEGLTPFWNLYKIYDRCCAPGEDRSMKILVVLFFVIVCGIHSVTHSETVNFLCGFAECVILMFAFIEMMQKFDTDYPTYWAFGLLFLAPIFWPALGFGEKKFNSIKLIVDNKNYIEFESDDYE